MKIFSNHHARPLLSLAELPETERSDFDYIDAEDHHAPRLFRYRGALYDLHEFILIRRASDSTPPSFFHVVHDTESPLLDWHAIQTESYFSAVVVRVDPENPEYVVVGRAHA